MTNDRQFPVAKRHAAMALEDHLASREGPRLVGAKDVHGAQVLNRVEPLDDDLLADDTRGSSGRVSGAGDASIEFVRGALTDLERGVHVGIMGHGPELFAQRGPVLDMKGGAKLVDAIEPSRADVWHRGNDGVEGEAMESQSRFRNHR